MKIVPPNKHSISYKDISKNALKVLERLNKAGFEAYLVGGSVRDLLIGIKPKDFDITTNATPEQTRKLFRNCRLIGRRFRLAHVFFGKEIIEVSTFRGQTQIETLKDNLDIKISVNQCKGMLLNDNIFGSIEEDSQRRDFSVNSLYYSTSDYTLRDYTGGLKDIKKRIIRLIGDPETRYREDPVRMLRAIRFSAKLDMAISNETAEPIPRLAELLNNISLERLFEEALKLLQDGYGELTYHLLCEYKLLQSLFPLVSYHFTKFGENYMEKMITKVLRNTDYRLRNDMRVNPAFLFASMLWYPLLEHVRKLTQDNIFDNLEIFSQAINEVLKKQCKTLAIPKRMVNLVRDIWQLQLRFPRRQGKRAYKIIEHQKFHAAYDLLSLRAEVENDDKLKNLTNWWNEFQKSTQSHQKNMIITLDLKMD